MSELSEAARTALMDVGTNRQGATIPTTTAVAVRRELGDAGLIGRTCGLTRKGTIVRERLMDAALEEAFGA